MTWFFVFMTVFGTTNLKEVCYGKGLSQFCIVQIDVVPSKRGTDFDI